MNRLLVITVAGVIVTGLLSTVTQDATNAAKWALVQQAQAYGHPHSIAFYQNMLDQSQQYGRMLMKVSIIGDFGIGYQAGKNTAYNGYGDYCPGGSNSYCTGFHVGWAAEEAAISQAQP